jgi:hypothetical protein
LPCKELPGSSSTIVKESKAKLIDMENAQNIHGTIPLVFGLGTTGAKYVNRLVSILQTNNQELLPNQCFIVMDTFEEELNCLEYIDQNNKIILKEPMPIILQEFDPDLPTDYHISYGRSTLNRRMGIAYYRYNRDEIRARIMNIAQRLIQLCAFNKFQIIIVSSLFGGTGSGCLIDFALDLRELLFRFGWVENSLIALGLLPHLNSNPTTSANAMATLKEVSFIRRIKNAVNVEGKEYVDPFDAFFIVGTEKNGIGIDSTVEWAVAKLLIDLGIIRSNAEIPQFDLGNLRVLMRNNTSEFSTFGLYSVRVPVPEIKLVINAATAIAQDEADLDHVMESLGVEDESGRIEAKLRAIKDDVTYFSEKRSKRTHQLSSLLYQVSNRFPKLTKQLIEDQRTVEECNIEIAEIDRRLVEIMEKYPRAYLKNTLKLLFEQKETMYSERIDLQHAVATNFSLRLPISPDALESLKSRVPYLDRKDLRQISVYIGQEDDFRAIVVRNLYDYSLLSDAHILLDYQMEPHQRFGQLSIDVLQILFDWGRAEKNVQGVLELKRQKVGFTALVASSGGTNLELVKPYMQPLRHYALERISDEAEFGFVESNLNLHSVNYYILLLGMPLYDSDPRHPSRLRELNPFSNSYDSMKDNILESISRHAFLSGNPLAFSRLTGISVEGLDTNERNLKVLDFWRNYEIVDSETRVDQIYVELARAFSMFGENASDFRLGT